MTSEARFCRQEILPEIGPSGQARLLRATLRLPRGTRDLASKIARSYAERAGIAQVVESSTLIQVSPDSAPWLAAFRYAAPLEIAQGATLALNSIRQALTDPSQDPPLGNPAP